MPLSQALKEELVARYSPVLSLDAGEPSFPVHPGAFVESSALWSSTPPLHVRLQWGLAGASGREPLLQRGAISLDSAQDVHGVADPDGDGVNEHYLAEYREEHFPYLTPHERDVWLDGAGWQDSDTVAVGSANLHLRRAGRTALVQPWYSADVWSIDDLKREMGQEAYEQRFGLGSDDHPAPLESVIAVTFAFLWPEHRQPRKTTGLAPKDDPWSADYEGDWSHFAVIGRLEGASVSDFTPLFGAFGQRWRGTRDDLEDLQLARMELRDWESLVAFDGHPLVVAASGTHNLHPHDPALNADGDIELKWIDFGKSSSQSVNAWVGDVVEQPYSAVLAAKVLAGLALGGLPGLIVGAVAAAAETSLALDEGLWTTPELEEDPAPDPPGEDPFDEDAADLAKNSLAMPAGLADPPFFDPDAAERRDWMTSPSQALIDGSIVLDRTPGEGRRFFAGRWGVRCDADPLLLRSGIQLPTWRAQIVDALLKRADGGPPW
ncbi:hypothetical protein HMI51_37575 [Corallococcus coralloides]|nr:hypothetical protein [Corallococcus coralloides]